MTDILYQDLSKTISTLKQMQASYRERIPTAYRSSFKATVNRYIGTAKALLYMKSGLHHAR